MAHSDNSGSALRILLKFCGMKGANGYMNFFFFFFFWEKISFGAISSFSDQGHFLLFDWTWLKLSQVTVTIGSLNSQNMITFMITAGSLNIQDMIRILKQSKHDFSGKHLCHGYCKDIMWCLCVEVKIHGFIKLL